MPPPRGTPNPIEGPGDYATTAKIHNDAYPAINPKIFDYSSRAVLIVGASKGLGHAMLLSYAAARASFIAAGARSDLTSLAPAVEAAAVRKEFGKLNVVVRSAGAVLNRALLADRDPDVWWAEMSLNILGPMLVARAFIPLLLESPLGYLAFVSSAGAWKVNPTLSAYQTDKAALTRLCMHIDSEYSAKGLDGKEGLSDILKPVFVDTLEISAHNLCWITSGKREWVRGRYVNVTLDMEDLEAWKGEIVEKDLLKIKLDI